MLETVREYAQERLAAAGELAAARRAHAYYFLALAERADARAARARSAGLVLPPRARARQPARGAPLVARSSRTRRLRRGGEREAGLRLAAALGYFWYVRGYHTEGRRWLEEALARAPQSGEDEAEREVDSAARTRALIAEGPLLMVQAQYTRARAVLKEALALAERRQDPTAIAEASTYLGTCHGRGRGRRGRDAAAAGSGAPLGGAGRSPRPWRNALLSRLCRRRGGGDGRRRGALYGRSGPAG